LFNAQNVLFGIAFSNRYLAMIESVHGQWEVAARLYSEAIAIAQKLRDPWEVTRLMGCVAELAASRDDFGSAAVLLGAASAAYALSRSSPLPYNREVQLSAESIARARLGDLDYQRTFDDGTRLQLPEALEFAAAIVSRSLSASAPAPTRDDAGLSSRELEVLAMLTAGHTDQQIADALFVSRRTVNTHVAHILAKLGASSRTEAAAEAVRRNLV
jgi:DNA-binding CsgD family transcriptional regulator